jgi:ribose-phosphate pyrophosphokinase
MVVLSPDVGSVSISQAYAKRLGMHFALIDKRRYSPNKAEVKHLIGNLEGKDVLIIDDMIDTAGTLVNAAEAALKHRAKSVSAVATHPVLSEPALERIRASEIEHILLTDTIFISEHKKMPNMDIVSVSDIFGEAIKRIHKGESVSALFGF